MPRTTTSIARTEVGTCARPGAAENTPAVIVDLATPRMQRRRSLAADQRVPGGGMKITG